MFSWFSQNEKFEINKDFTSLLIVSDDELLEKEVIKISLDRMEEIKIIKKVDVPNRDLWVLEKPLSSFEQNIQVDGQMANQISEIINNACYAIDDYEDLCNPLDLNEKDLNNLIFICHKLYDHNSDKKLA